jgi:hypothetical protein
MLEWAEPRLILAKPDSSVVWVQEDSFARHGGANPPPLFHIYAFEADGFHTLADLPETPQDVKLAGARLTWLQAGTRHEATVH